MLPRHLTTVILCLNLLAFKSLDYELQQMAEKGIIKNTEGSTATAALILNDELHLAYVGDSAAILIQKDNRKIIDLCPELDVAEDNLNEVERIRESDGIVLKVGKTMRVQGELALTRSLGAAKYKPYVIADPHICHYDIHERENSFLVLASDGLWKVMSNKDVAELVLNYSNLNETEIAERLHDAAVKRNSTDNITIVVINIEKMKEMERK